MSLSLSALKFLVISHLRPSFGASQNLSFVILITGYHHPFNLPPQTSQEFKKKKKSSQCFSTGQALTRAWRQQQIINIDEGFPDSPVA